MSTNKFDGFDNTMSPVTADYVVGFGDVGGTDVEKRWSISVLKTLWQGMLNITRLARESSNYVQITGGALASSRVDIAAAGADANVHLWLSGKGAGSVQTPAGLNVGGDLVIGGYIALASNISMGGGTLNTQGGDIETQGGDISIGAGGILYTDTITPVGTDITLNGNLIVASNLTAGIGLNEFLIDSTKMQYGGVDGLILTSAVYSGTNTVRMRLVDDATHGFDWQGYYNGATDYNYAHAIGDVSGNGISLQAVDNLGGGGGSDFNQTKFYHAGINSGNHGLLDIRDAWTYFQSKSVLGDAYIETLTSGAGGDAYFNAKTAVGTASYKVNDTQVLTDQKTGWTCTKHATPLRNVDLSDAGITAVDLAQALTALLEDLGTTHHGVIDQA